MSELLEEHCWPGKHFGQRVLFYDTVGSTNDLAAQFGEPGMVILAREQTTGRGQHGRVWHSDRGSSLLMSLVVAPPAPLRRPVLLTAWASVAIAEAIHQLTGLEARLKWPNDLLINQLKVCGILIEQSHQVILGLGLNLTQSGEEFTAAGLPTATSLYVQSGRVSTPLTAAQTVLNQLDLEYDKLLQGDYLPLESAWRERIGLLDQPVRVELLDGSSQTGLLTRLGFEDLQLLDADGRPFVTMPERVRHIWPA